MTTIEAYKLVSKNVDNEKRQKVEKTVLCEKAFMNIYNNVKIPKCVFDR